MKTNAADQTPWWGGLITVSCLASLALGALPLSRTFGGERSWTPAELASSERITSLAISPTNPQIAVWTQVGPDKAKDEEVTHIFQYVEGRVVQLTRGKESCLEPRFSPDGRTIAFLSARPDPSDEKAAKASDSPKNQIWLLDGGEPYRLTQFSRKIQAFAWRDTNHIVLTAQEPATQREREFEEKKDKSRLVEDEVNEPPVRLFEVEIKTRQITRLTSNTDRISFLAVSPNGERAVTFHSRSLRFEYDNQIRPQYFLIDLRTGDAKRIFADQRFNLHSVVWSPDSRSFYAVNNVTPHPRYLMAWTSELWRWETDLGKEVAVPLDWTQGLESNLGEESGLHGIVAPLADGFLALLADGVHPKVARYRREGEQWKRALLEGKERTNTIAVVSAVAPPQTIVWCIRSSASLPSQLFHGALDGDRLQALKQVTELNSGWKEKRKASVEVVHWRGARGDEIEGLLYFPPDYQPGARCPLMLVIHGGPFWADFDAWRESWHFPIQPHCERGALVLRANYHGSSSYGRAFAESIAGGMQYYDLPVEDLERGVDALIERGLVDPEKIGVMGWSNGAILTLALITRHPERYKAAAAGAGGFEWIADTSVTSFGQAFNHYYFGKMPWEDPELYRRLAPYYDADRITTPLIIFHGDTDTAVPVHHGWMQFRALQQRTKTPVRLVIFPGEEHGLKKISSMRRKLEEELAWFDAHLYRTGAGEQRWLKQGSLISSLLARSRAKQSAGRLGDVVEGKLIPETLLFKGFRVGRFEVTRAQFSQFDPGYLIPPGKDNFPANQISFDQANAYCQWLSQFTKAKWRLPNRAELEKLYEDRDIAENTLDFWAGYSPNAEDAARLLQSVQATGLASLLREVGSFAGVGNDPVFDLGGNVAEWTVLPDGSGQLSGGSADQAKESFSRRSEASLDCSGLRVIRE